MESVTVKTNQLPQILLFDGATGAGKSFLLEFLRKEYEEKILVGTKLTTRQKRISDNEWEFRFVKRILEPHSRYSYSSVGNQYAIDDDELKSAIDRGLVYAVSCVDRRTIETLKADFITVTIYLYRSWTAKDLEALLASRGTSDRPDSELRREEVLKLASQYMDKIELYDHVLLNVGSQKDLFEQLIRILILYGITQDAVTGGGA